MAYTRSFAQAGRGTIFAIGPISGTVTPVYVPVGEIKTTDPGKGTFDKEEVSNLESGLDKEFLKLMRDNGAPKLSGNRVGSDAGQLAVVAAYNDGDNSYMIKVTLPINKKAGQIAQGDAYTYDALVMGQSFGPVETNKAIAYEVELQITGPVTFTPGS
jgi:hypothetical protein